MNKILYIATIGPESVRTVYEDDQIAVYAAKNQPLYVGRGEGKPYQKVAPQPNPSPDSTMMGLECIYVSVKQPNRTVVWERWDETPPDYSGIVIDDAATSQAA